MRPPFQPRSFESMCFTVTSSAATVVVLLLYRPGSSDVTSEFFVEFAKLLESLALYKCQIIVAGDFNIHMEDVVNPNTKQLNDILDSFHCTQHVPLTPTHLKQRTLDLVVTKSDQLVERLQVDPPGIFSDRSLISWSVPIQHQPPLVLQREVRCWAKSSQVFVYLTGMSECRPVHRTMLHNKNSNVRIKQYSNGISLECDEL